MPTSPQWPPVTTRVARRVDAPVDRVEARDLLHPVAASRAAAIRIAERNISGSPMKFASAIIVASLRTSSAIPFEKPANDHGERARRRASTTTQPSSAAVDRARRARGRRARITSAWIIAVSPRADRLRERDREPARGRREEALDDVVLEVVDHRHPRPRAAEERVHDDDPREQELDVRAACRRAGAARARRAARRAAARSSAG